jgi:hypothetical protein
MEAWTCSEVEAEEVAATIKLPVALVPHYFPSLMNCLRLLNRSEMTSTTN